MVIGYLLLVTKMAYLLRLDTGDWDYGRDVLDYGPRD